MESPKDRKPLVFENSEFLRDLSYSELDVLCEQIRQEIILTCSQRGGHLSSNLGAVELTVALHRFFHFPKDKLIFDVGHQCYTHKILTGRSIEHLNQKGCVAGFQKRKESECDPWEAGHSSTSISAAQAFAYARDQKKEDYDVVAFIGDASIVNGLSLEALNDVGSGENKIIVILNDNDMSISKPVGAIGSFFRRISTGKAYNRFKRGFRKALHDTKLYAFFRSLKNKIKSRLLRINIFDTMGFAYIGPIDGNSIKDVEKALKRAKQTNKSVIVHCHTMKGKGYRYAENDQNGYWHGVTPFDIETGAPKNLHPGLISWSHYFADLTDQIMGEKTDGLLVIPATRKGSGMEKVFADYPDRCHDVGIAEEHAATLCGGLAANGYHPILSIYSTFMQRAYDEIAHDCARMNANMTILIDRAGLGGSAGDTHQGIYDVAYLKSIPNVVITMPSSKAIAKALYYQSFDNHGVFAIRYPREFVRDSEDANPPALPFLRWRHDRPSTGHTLAIVAVGPKEKEILAEAQKRFLDVEIIDPVYLYPLQKDNILPLTRFQNVLIYDAYGTREGFADTLCSALMEAGYRGKVHVRAVTNSFVQHASVDEQLASFGLLPAQIIELAEKILGR